MKTVTRRSFTIKASGVLRQLATPCFVSLATKHMRAADRPPSRQFRSIWDTGATFSMVSQRVVHDLGLKTDGYVTLHHAGGEAVGVPTYRADFLLYNNVQFADVRVGLVNVRDIDVIIGMDIINRGDFAVSNKDGSTSFSFRIPSVADFDFASEDNVSGSNIGAGIDAPVLVE